MLTKLDDTSALIVIDLQFEVIDRCVRQIVMTSVATTAGVESMARSAYDLGYNVTLVVDAMTDRDAEAHRYAVEKLFPRIGETAMTDDVLNLLQ